MVGIVAIAVAIGSLYGVGAHGENWSWLALIIKSSKGCRRFVCFLLSRRGGRRMRTVGAREFRAAMAGAL